MAVASARATCKIEQVGEAPVKLTTSRIIVSVSINGHPVEMFIDTGSPITVITADSAVNLHLPRRPANVILSGVGGKASTEEAYVQELRFGHFSLVKNSIYIAGRRTDPDAPVGVIGRDMFGDNDVELDLAHGTIRLLRPQGCSPAELVYWGGTSYSEAPLQSRETFMAPYTTEMVLNGRAFPATLDTGAPRTTITTGVAHAAGVTATSPGSQKSKVIGGIGVHKIPSFSGEFASIGIGDEVIKNTRVHVADMFRYNIEQQTGSHLPSLIGDPIYLLLGLDFVRSHRLIISNTQHKLLFTYTGGQVFDASPPPDEPATPPPPKAAVANGAPAAPKP